MLNSILKWSHNNKIRKLNTKSKVVRFIVIVIIIIIIFKVPDVFQLCTIIMILTTILLLLIIIMTIIIIINKDDHHTMTLGPFDVSCVRPKDQLSLNHLCRWPPTQMLTFIKMKIILAFIRSGTGCGKRLVRVFWDLI